MDRMKELTEKIEAIKVDMNKLNEERKFEEFNAKDAELTQLENELRMLKRNLKAEDPIEKKEDEAEVRTIADEIRDAISSGKEIDISNIEIRDMGMKNPPTSGNTTVGNLSKDTFANYIIQKLPALSRLYAATRQEPLSGASHSIPVQKTKLGKFVSVAELAEYTKKNADYSTIKLEPHKYGALVVFSEEALEDTAYNIEADVRGQIEEGYAQTVEELIVKGDSTTGVEGLNSIGIADGAKELTQATKGSVTTDELLKLYGKLPRQYRKNATWVMNDATAQVIAGLKDADGKPLMFTSYNGEPFGDGATLLGRPVIVSDECDGLDAGAGKKAIFFGDISKAIVVGPRKTLTIKKDESVGFLNDSVAIKATTRVDVKKALGEAMAYLKGIA